MSSLFRINFYPFNLRLSLALLAASPLLTDWAPAFAAPSRITINLNPAWRFISSTNETQPSRPQFDDSGCQIVSLPHSLELIPANLSGFGDRGRTVGWYRRDLQVQPEWRGKKLFLEFQGAMQKTALWVNGKPVGEYAVCGYDSFHFDITPFLHEGTNLLAVRIDNRPDRVIPPDGQEMDYVLFGGIYRDVFLHVTDPVHLTFPWEARQAGVRITMPEVSEKKAIIAAESTVRNESDKDSTCTLLTEFHDLQGKLVASGRDEHRIPARTEFTFTQKLEAIPNPHLWSPDAPYLYRVETILLQGDKELDRLQTPLGIRGVTFDKQKGFYLNGKPLKLVGANRHQTWPFIGNAVPNGLQRHDAEQMKAMGINWIRLSHYPQDPDFLSALDELGIMALEEPATWMRPGPGKWMTNLVASFRSMIRRDRNHPCIVLWGACINHQPADPALVGAAIEEDPSRERGQDTVPIPMNFTPGVVSGGGALAVEHTGHTFPAARGERQRIHRVGGREPRVETSINREYEQAKRHWEQLNAAYLKPDNAGLAVWCMYDYNTFHNVDEPGIVWHGVCDLFRIPKFSYWWHVSELTTKPMAYIVRVDSTNATVFSNCERVRLSENCGEGYREVGIVKPPTEYTNAEGKQIPYALRHPPFQFNVSASARALKAEGLTGGSIKATCEWKQPGRPAALTLEADRPMITADGADLSRIIVTAVDTNGTPVDTCRLPVTFTLSGPGQLVGENPATLRAGKMITLAQSAVVPGEMTISATAPGLRAATVKVTTTPAGPDVDMPNRVPATQPTPDNTPPASQPHTQ